MSEQNKIIGLSLTFVAVFIVSFFNLYESAKVEQDILKTTNALYRLRIENAMLFNQINNDFKKQNYDKLNRLSKAFTSNWNNLSDDVKTKYSNHKEMVAQIVMIDEAMKKGHSLSTHYESEKAVLANSVFYLVKLESSLRHKSDEFSVKFSDSLNAFLKDVIYYNVGQAEINEHVAGIKRYLNDADSTNGLNAKIMQKHLEIFYEKSNGIRGDIQDIQAIGMLEKLNNLEKSLFDIVDYERRVRSFTNIIVALFSFFMLIGFLIAFFKIYRDKIKILLLKEENDLRNHEIVEHTQLLNEYKKALDKSSIVSKTNLNGIITYVNDKFCEISGYSRKELIGRPHNVVRHEDMPKEIFAELWRTIESKKTFHATIKNKKKNNDFYYVDSTILPILDIAGNIEEYFAVRHDVTDLIKAKEDAQAAEKAKGSFLATMSHELRTPLNAVIGFSQIILAKEDLGTESLKSYTEKINVSGKHLLRIVNNMLDFSKIESGQMELHKKMIDLLSLIGDATTLVETSANAKKIKLVQNGLVGATVYADEQLLKQVVLNILSNAIKFTPQNKTITLSCESQGNECVISVCDEGVGLTKSQAETIFRPFSQVKEHQAEDAKGTGLGLAISQKIVALHGGRIEVTSEVGNGSCFNVRLPQSKDEK